MIGDATCCLLTCEGMIGHHLITSIYTRVAQYAEWLKVGEMTVLILLAEIFQEVTQENQIP